MGTEMLGAVVALLLLLFMFVFACLRGGTSDRAEAGLPRKLRGAEIAYAEQTFRSNSRMLVARIDRAYRTTAGLQLLELKTRARDAVYMADVIELSVQRVAMQDHLGEAVLPDAWVVVQHAETGARRTHRVTLLSTEEVAAHARRFRAVQAGDVDQLTPARSQRQCRKCGHRARCNARFHDRD